MLFKTIGQGDFVATYGKRHAVGKDIAAFGYALLHTVFYLIDMKTVAAVTADLPKVYVWTG